MKNISAKPNLKSNRGQTLIILALIVSMASMGAIATIFVLNESHMHSIGRSQSLVQAYTTMHSFGTEVQRAYDQGMLNPTTCPAGTRSITGNAGSHFCLPQTPVCENGYCLSEIFTAGNDSFGPVLQGRLVAQNSTQRAVDTVAEFLYSFLDDRAYAQRVYQRPQQPTSIAQKISVIDCTSNALCRKCDHSSLDCLTLQVCPKSGGASCSASELWVQRYGIRLAPGSGCPSTVVNWGTAPCAGNVTEALPNATQSVTAASPNTGSATFLCSNGTWSPSGTPTCVAPTPPPPPTYHWKYYYMYTGGPMPAVVGCPSDYTTMMYGNVTCTKLGKECSRSPPGGGKGGPPVYFFICGK